MSKKLKRPLALIFSAVVFLALLMFAPPEITRSTGFEIIAGAEEAEEYKCPQHSDSYLSYSQNGNGTHYAICYGTFDVSACERQLPDQPCTFNDYGQCVHCEWDCNHPSKEADGKCSLCGYYEVSDRETAVGLIKKALLNRDAKVRMILTGAIVENQQDSECVNIIDGLYSEAITHTSGGNSALGDYIAKTIETYGRESVYGSGSSGLIFIKTCYSFTYYTTSEQEQAVTTALGGIYSTLNLSDSSLTDLEKVYKIYNWIVTNVSYDYDNLNNESNKTKYTAYGALNDNKAVCQGFAALFYRMCLDNGIDCRIVTGTAGGDHAWNIVKVGEKYYYADPTWDCRVTAEDATDSRQAKPGTFFYFLRGTLANHTESTEENVTNAYTGSMAGAEEYLSAFKAAIVSGAATAVHLDGTPLSDAEKTWYDVAAAGESCPVTITVKGSSGIVSDNDLAGLELLSAVMEHNFGEDGFCTICDSGYQPATLNNGVYEIGNAGQLYWFAQQVNGGNTTINAVLTTDITLTAPAEGESNWTAIGTDYNPFTGKFDGANKTISGLFFNKEINNVGLFAIISTGGTVKNVGVVDSYFSGSTGVGGVCGLNEGTIENCYNTGTVTGSGQYVGGVCGLNAGTIENCYNTGAVSGAQYFGGVCGGNEGNEGKILNCYNTGTVTGLVANANYAGGVCGSNTYAGKINNCYNTGAVSGSSKVGDVCGYNNSSSTISNCYYLEGTANSGIGTDEGTSDKVESKTDTQFGSGEVAYLLQSGQTEDENGIIPEVWGQDLSTTTNYPVLGGDKVYQTAPCVSYTNSENTVKEHTDENGDETCDVCKAKTVYIVSLTSQPDGFNASVANLDGGGKIKAGESTTITASAVPGYTFNGWYEGNTKLSADLSFEYTPTADVTLTAKYTANAKMTVNINGGENFTLRVNDVETAYDSNNSQFAVGTKLTVTAKGENFAYWQNEAGSVLSRSAEYTFTVVNGATVTAVYDTKIDSKAIVNFISGYDQIINRYQITAADDFTVPASPTKTGCDFAGWSINGAAAITENVADAVKAAITKALATEDTADDIINVKATYTTKVQKVTVTVNSGSGSDEYNVNDVVTVTANAPESGNKFSHWTDGNGTILSYNTSYSFYASKAIALTAVYVADTETVTAVGTTEIVDVSTDKTNKTITFISLSTVPEGCAIQKAGVIATNNATVANGTFDDTTAIIIRGNSWSGSSYRYSWTIGMNDPDVIVYARAYLVYTDKNGNTHTIYGAVKSTSVNG